MFQIVHRGNDCGPACTFHNCSDKGILFKF